MFRRLYPFILFTLTTVLSAACQNATTVPLDPAPTKTITSPTSTNGISSTNVSDVVPPTHAPYSRLHYTMHGVRLSLDTPSGWESDIMDGLLLAEHTAPMDDGTPEIGMLVYIFAPPRSEFGMHTGRRDSTNSEENFAYSVLRHVLQTPNRVGRNVEIVDPVPFTWDGYAAAYYLLSSSEASTLVLAVALPPALGTRTRLVVCNASVPSGREANLREQLPQVLDGLTIDGVRLSGEALESLPDPLPFPRRTAYDETALLPTDPSRERDGR